MLKFVTERKSALLVRPLLPVIGSLRRVLVKKTNQTLNLLLYYRSTINCTIVGAVTIWD